MVVSRVHCPAKFVRSTCDLLDLPFDPPISNLVLTRAPAACHGYEPTHHIEYNPFEFGPAGQRAAGGTRKECIKGTRKEHVKVTRKECIKVTRKECINAIRGSTGTFCTRNTRRGRRRNHIGKSATWQMAHPQGDQSTGRRWRAHSQGPVLHGRGDAASGGRHRVSRASQSRRGAAAVAIEAQDGRGKRCWSWRRRCSHFCTTQALLEGGSGAVSRSHHSLHLPPTSTHVPPGQPPGSVVDSGNESVTIAHSAVWYGRRIFVHMCSPKTSR